MGPIYPLSLFGGCGIGLNVNFSEALTNNKWPLGIDPGDHHFVVLNVSTNQKPVFVLYVVTYKTSPRSKD